MDFIDPDMPPVDDFKSARSMTVAALAATGTMQFLLVGLVALLILPEVMYGTLSHSELPCLAFLGIGLVFALGSTMLFYSFTYARMAEGRMENVKGWMIAAIVYTFLLGGGWIPAVLWGVALWQLDKAETEKRNRENYIRMARSMAAMPLFFPGYAMPPPSRSDIESLAWGGNAPDAKRDGPGGSDKDRTARR